MAYNKKYQTSKKRVDVHQIVTDKIIEAIENGIKGDNWEMPWTNRGFESGFPTNAESQNLYSGVNVPVLWTMADIGDFKTNIWATYKQWKEMDCQVKKGESSAPVVFYKSFEIGEDKRRDENDDGQRMTIKRYNVFNLEQVDGDYEAPEIEPLPDLVERIKKVDEFVKNTGAEIRHGGGKAFHSSSRKDGSNSYIQMPFPERFIPVKDSTPTENYYATLLHELTHWTKTPKRLDRKFDLEPAKMNYALEELVAELGSSMLGASLKIEHHPRENHMEYIASWLKILKSDKKAFFKAAAKAQEATSFLYKFQDIESEKQVA